MDGITAYRSNQIGTESRGRLIVMLYEGAIKFLNLALDELQAGEFDKKGEHINKAIDIIHELNVCLDMDAGGEIAENLRGLYLFMIRHLTEANMQRDPQRIREVVSLLTDLNEGWKAITV
ncbi:MAG: flagellar export chaperone FliS [Phycisphaerae bacterium]